MLTKFVAYILPITGLFLVSVFVLLRSHKSRVNRIFALLSFTAAVWLSLLFVADTTTSQETALLFVRAAVAVSNVIAVLFLFFSYNFPFERHISNRLLGLVCLPAGAFFILSFSSAMAPDVDLLASGAQLTATTGLYSIYSVTALAYFLAGSLFLLRNKKGATLNQKQQINLVLLGVMVAFFVNLITGFLLTLIEAQGNNTNLIGSFSLLTFAAFTAYAIVRHQLFDIRSFVVRSVAYVLSLTVLGLIFIIPVVAISTLVFQIELQPNTIAFLSLITFLVALLFHPLRNWFNRTTNRLFYRDYYEPQDVLDRLSDLLVGSVDVQEIEQQSAKILSSALKPTKLRYLLTADKEKEDIESRLLSNLLKTKKDGIIADELDSHHETKLKNLMVNTDTAISVRLKTTHGDLGFIALGYKQSGGIYSENDLKMLRIAADEIAVGLQNALRFEEIQRFNITLQQKIEEATRELRKVNARLKELDATKDEFISMASHQLRTPLTAVKGYLSMVLEGDMGSVAKNQKEVLQRAYNGAQSMVYLIADLLNVSRLQTGKFVIENKPTNLAAVVEKEVLQLQAAAEARKLKLTYHKPAQFPSLLLDENKIRQVVMNFIDNAIYYTPAGGSIDVALTSTPDSVTYTVTDTGLGVPASERPHLFTKFYRAGNARKMRPDGTGLGLYMAKKVVVAQGGAIIFKSTEGKGSVFGFSFPLPKSQPGS